MRLLVVGRCVGWRASRLEGEFLLKPWAVLHCSHEIAAESKQYLLGSLNNDGSIEGDGCPFSLPEI